MSYFQNLYSSLSYPISNAEEPIGLRNAQIGAIHSIASHFTLFNNTIALIVMPTGSGKTAVITMSPYVLCAKRVLVLSSSVLVRGQIVDKFKTLETLKLLDVFPKNAHPPKVKELTSSIKKANDWEELKKYDVTVTIPLNISNSIKNGFQPPSDLYDLVIVDEAHHSKAETWNKTIKYFSSAKKIFFTATPFRNDKQEVEGKIIYKYPLSQAHKDGIFGNIGYVPIELNGNPNIDIAIAKEAEKIYKEDNSKDEINHRLMVRTEGKKHADELKKIYEENTNLKLKIVNSNKKYSVIKNTIKDLRDAKLDGIICNNMLGEGFDFPNLKIAAIHKPHSSLPITLQFIGRFARTNANDIGNAKFIAPTNDILIAKKELYHSESIWQKIIHELSDVAIDEVDNVKQVLDTFNNVEEIESDNDFSMFNLFPYFHLKIYHADEFYLDEEVRLSGHTTLYHKVSSQLNAVIIVTQESKKNKWVKTHDLDDKKHHLFIIFYDEDNDLLYINTSSLRSEKLYEYIAETYTDDNFQRLSKSEINKVLLDIEDISIFNMGMSNKSPQFGESYRQLTGNNTGSKVKPTDSKLYSAGHVFLKGSEENKTLTIGYSGRSKVWSHKYVQIPFLIESCKKLSVKIHSEKEVKTNSGFDNLSTGKTISKFPSEVVYATWNSDTYKDPVNINVVKSDVIIEEVLFSECYFEIERSKTTLEVVNLSLVSENHILELTYDFDNHYQESESQDIMFVTEDGESIVDYLNSNSLQYVLFDFSNVINNDWYPVVNIGNYDFNLNGFRVIDWNTKNIDINIEYYENEADKINNNKLSIHEGIEEMLLNSDVYNLIIYDHGAFELADYVAIVDTPNVVKFFLYHIKRTKEVNAGIRVSDVDELISQCLRSTNWIANRSIITEKLTKRLKNKEHKFVRGDMKSLLSCLTSSKTFEFTISLVQPGLSKQKLKNSNNEEKKISNALSHLDSTIQQGGSNFIVMGSS